MALSNSASTLLRSAIFAVRPVRRASTTAVKHQLLGKYYVGAIRLAIIRIRTCADLAGERLVAGHNPGVAAINAESLAELLK